MLKKGTIWYDAVLDWGLNPGHHTLEASNLPLGYRGIKHANKMVKFGYLVTATFNNCTFSVYERCWAENESAQ